MIVSTPSPQVTSVILLYPENQVSTHSQNKATEVRLVQPEKADSPMEMMLLGMVKVVRPVQFQKAELPMEVTLLGMVTEVRLVQYWKAHWPMEVTLLGMVMEVRPEQPEYLQVVLYQPLVY